MNTEAVLICSLQKENPSCKKKNCIWYFTSCVSYLLQLCETMYLRSCFYYRNIIFGDRRYVMSIAQRLPVILWGSIYRNGPIYYHLLLKLPYRNRMPVPPLTQDLCWVTIYVNLRSFREGTSHRGDL